MAVANRCAGDAIDGGVATEVAFEDLVGKENSYPRFGYVWMALSTYSTETWPHTSHTRRARPAVIVVTTAKCWHLACLPGPPPIPATYQGYRPA